MHPRSESPYVCSPCNAGSRHPVLPFYTAAHQWYVTGRGTTNILRSCITIYPLSRLILIEILLLHAICTAFSNFLWSCKLHIMYVISRPQFVCSWPVIHENFDLYILHFWGIQLNFGFRVRSKNKHAIISTRNCFLKMKLSLFVFWKLAVMLLNHMLCDMY